MGSIAKCIQEAQRGAVVPLRALQQVEMPELASVQDTLAKLVGDFNVVELVTPQGVTIDKSVCGLEEYREEWMAEAKQGVWLDPQFCYDMEMVERIAGKQPELNKLYDTLEAMHSCATTMTEKLRIRLLLARVSSALGATYLASGILHRDDAVALGGSMMRYNRFGRTQGIDWAGLLEWAQIGLEDLRGQRKCLGGYELTPQQTERLREMRLDAQKIARWFQWAVEVYGFDYDVVVDATATAIDVRETSSAGGPVIVIPESRQVDGLKLVTLMRHEIDCHARDSYNGRELLWGLGGGALRAEDDVVYEGHAMTEENAILRYCTGESPRQALPWYTLAIARASTGSSFGDVAREIYNLRRQAGAKEAAALKGAWTSTYRVFRGVSDARNPRGYAFWKDKAYLQGTLEIGKLYDAELGHWAELGAFELDELVAIAQAVRIEPSDLPYPDLNTAEQALWRLLLSS